jgi:hypothetical protein
MVKAPLTASERNREVVRGAVTRWAGPDRVEALLDFMPPEWWTGLPSTFRSFV